MEEIDFLDHVPGTGLLKLFKFKEIYQLLKRNVIRCFSRKRRIVIYGESGSGKTQFLHTFLGIENFDEQRTQTIDEYPMKLSSGHKVIFIDTPGNQSLSYIRQQLAARYAKNEICGIINIVAYGYQSVPNTDLARVFNIDTNEVKPQFLDENKQRELRQLEEWKQYVTADSGVKWFITIVNKADIWYGNMENTMAYYQSGPYHEAIRELVNVCKVMSYPFCSLIAPFFNRRMPLEMSQREQIKMHKNFKKKLIELITEYA
jgi:energy-coupling factor transporter ATP-binding protein EcfA2